MYLEFLLITSCYFSNLQACTTSAQAYYQFSGIDKMVNEFGAKNLSLTYIVTAAGVFKEQKVIIPFINSSNNSIDLQITPKLGLLVYKRGI